MAKTRPDSAINPDLSCPKCNSRGRALVGKDEQMRQNRWTCRKCDSEFWGNQATGMVQATRDQLREIADDSQEL